MDKIDVRTLGKVKASAADAGAGLVPREMPITVRYPVPGTRDVEEASVVSVGCLGVDDKARIARIEADMAGGRLWGLLPPQRQSYITAFATVLVQLKGAGKDGALPDWLVTAMGEDDDFLDKLYATVCAHRALFFGADVGSGDGAPAKPRFFVHAPLLAASTASDDAAGTPGA